VWFAFTLITSGCAASLTQQGTQVRLVDKQTDYSCVFVATVTGSNSMGNSTAHDAEGAMNELRNKAASYGANAVRVINIDSSPVVTTAVGEALNCKF
jgi:ribulose bisphosphate carboxylase small subunit